MYAVGYRRAQSERNDQTNRADAQRNLPVTEKVA